MAKKPSRTFTSLDDLYGWMQGIFKSQTKKGTVLSPKDKVAANYDIRIVSEPDSSDWEDILHCDYSEDFREVIAEQVDIWKPAAIGVVINYDGKQPFCACRLITEHIDVLDGKRKPEVISTPRQQNGILNGLGESGLGALAALDKENLRIELENKMENARTRHDNAMAMKERDLQDLRKENEALKAENSDLKSRIGELETENDDLQGQLDEANEASSSNTQSLLMGLASTFLANKGYDVSGLNGYLASRAEQQQPVAELPQATVETEEQGLSEGERRDAEIMMNWLRSLPEITRVEMIEVMKRVEANPILSRKLLNYIDHLYEKARQRKQLQQPKQNPVAFPQDEQPQDNEDANGNDNDYEEEENRYGATI